MSDEESESTEEQEEEEVPSLEPDSESEQSSDSEPELLCDSSIASSLGMVLSSGSGRSGRSAATAASQFGAMVESGAGPGIESWTFVVTAERKPIECTNSP